jgi:hypothetical protein
VAIGKVESPCNRSCTLDPETNICLGCFRTLEEIMGWSAYSPAQRATVLEQLPARRHERERRLALWRAGKTGAT